MVLTFRNVSAYYRDISASVRVTLMSAMSTPFHDGYVFHRNTSYSIHIVVLKHFPISGHVHHVPCPACVLWNTLRQKNPPFPEYFYLAQQCLICPAAPEHQHCAGAASRARSSTISPPHYFPDQTMVSKAGVEWSSRGFLNNLYHAEAGKDFLTFSITLPIPFLRCLKAKHHLHWLQ